MSLIIIVMHSYFILQTGCKRDMKVLGLYHLKNETHSVQDRLTDSSTASVFNLNITGQISYNCSSMCRKPAAFGAKLDHRSYRQHG